MEGDTEMSFLQECRRVIEHMQEQPFIVDDIIDDVPGDATIPTKLLNLKDEYTSLKSSIIEKETKLIMMQSIGSGDMPDITEAGGELKETRKQKQELKARQEENQSQLEERAEEVQNLKAQFQKKMEEVKALVQTGMEKVAQVSSLKEKLGMSRPATEFEIPFDLQSAHQQVHQTEQSIKAYESKVAALDVLLVSTEQSEAQVKSSCNQLSKEFEQQQQLLQSHETNKKEQDTLNMERLEWMEKNVSILQNLTRVKEVSVGPAAVVVTFDNTSTDVDTPLRLTLNFTGDLDSTGAKLTSASVNTDSFQVDDLVDKAQDKNDIPFLVKAVSKRWADHRLGVDKVEGQPEEY